MSNEIERLTRERDEALALLTVAREALKPFAELSPHYLPREPADESTHAWGDEQPFLADFHRAADALTTTGPAALAEVRARVWEEASGVADGWRYGDPNAVAACSWTGAQIASVLRNKAALCRAAAIRAEAQG